MRSKRDLDVTNHKVPSSYPSVVQIQGHTSTSHSARELTKERGITVEWSSLPESGASVLSGLEKPT